MQLLHRYLFAAMWLAWAGYWWLLAGDVKATARREPLSSRLLHIVPLAIALLLLWAPSAPTPWLGERLFAAAEWQFWAGAGLTAAGLLFSIWARHHLGRNWSATVTIKDRHELIVSGPYAMVRHPIYAGLLLAFIGFALACGEWRGPVAVLIALAALWRKLRLEERWLEAQFGETYRAYRRRVAALLPFIL